MKLIQKEEKRLERAVKFIVTKFKALGLKVSYAGLLLVYAYKRKETPKWAKRIVLGALAYLLSPIDVIPDLTPFLGYTDDLGMIIASLGSIAMYVDEEVKFKARKKLKDMFTVYDEYELVEIDKKIQTRQEEIK